MERRGKVWVGLRVKFVGSLVKFLALAVAVAGTGREIRRLVNLL
jgi:hypothetical protein